MKAERHSNVIAHVAVLKHASGASEQAKTREAIRRTDPSDWRACSLNYIVMVHIMKSKDVVCKE